MGLVRLTFIHSGGTRDELDGEAGHTAMEVARAHGIPGIEAVCGGGAICGTCHVHVVGGPIDLLSPPSMDERLTLQIVDHRGTQSRLACQIKLKSGLSGLVLEVPPTL
jgi:2Fe-2S ferredoxin